MKANKAPEKIYLQEPTKVRTERLYNNDIEYVQTDAFIEKAIGWINNNNRDGGCNFDGWEKDFKKYMKGE